MSQEDLHELEGDLDSAISTVDLDGALALARRIDADRRGGLDLAHALRLTALMLALRHPRGLAAADRWHERFRAERNPRRVEDEIADAALRGLDEPEIARFCERVLSQMIGAEM